MSNAILMKQAQQIRDLKKELRQKNKKIKSLTEWIEQSGENADTCTNSILSTTNRRGVVMQDGYLD